MTPKNRWELTPRKQLELSALHSWKYPLTESELEEYYQFCDFYDKVQKNTLSESELKECGIKIRELIGYQPKKPLLETLRDIVQNFGNLILEI